MRTRDQQRRAWPPEGGRYVLLLVSLSLLGAATAAQQLTRDDIEFRKKTYLSKAGEQIPYRLFVPLGYDKNRRYPLVLWLHGGDGRGSDNARQIGGSNTTGAHFFASEAVQLKFPLFVLAPQCPSGDNWSDPDLNEPSKWLQLTMKALAAVEGEFSIDPDRVYLVGQSMGGLGAWSALQAYPRQWAAAVIVSAYDNFTQIRAVADTPVWLFQGEADETVPVSLVRAMVKQLQKAGASLRYTEYPKTNHEAWKKAFAEPDLLPWMMSQKLGQAAERQSGSGATRTKP